MSTQDEDLFVLWAPLICNEPWQRWRMRRRAARPGDLAQRPASSTLTRSPDP